VLAVIYGIKRIAEDGPGSLPALSIVAGLAIGAAFVRRQTNLDDPLIDLRLFGVPAFGTALVANTLGTFLLGGMLLFVAQYLQLVLGMGPSRPASGACRRLAGSSSGRCWPRCSCAASVRRS